MKTTLPIAPENDDRKWVIVDVADKPLGRVAVAIANELRGKNRADYTPAVDMGSFVIVINAAQVALTGKKNEMKTYENYSGWRGGRKVYTVATIRAKNPERMIEDAVWGMLPKNNTATARMKRLRVFAGAEHLHAAQAPVVMDV